LIVVENVAGRIIRIEVDDDGQVSDGDLARIYGDEDTRASAGERVITAVRPLFTDALDLIESCAVVVADRLTRLGEAELHAPDELELQLAVKLDGKVGARIVELSAGAQLQVSLRWKRTGG
jgi:hypothetical protein